MYVFSFYKLQSPVKTLFAKSSRFHQDFKVPDQNKKHCCLTAGMSWRWVFSGAPISLKSKDLHVGLIDDSW